MRLNGGNAMLFVDMLVIASIIKWEQKHPDEAAENAHLFSDVQKAIDEYHLEGWRVARITSGEQLRNSLRKLRELGLVSPPLFQKQNVTSGPRLPAFIEEFRRRYGSNPWGWPYGIAIIKDAGAIAPRLNWETAELFPQSPIDMEITNGNNNHASRAESA